MKKEVTRLKTAGNATGTGASPGHKGEKKPITDRKGFGGLKHYNWEAAQWKDWPFKVTTWLTQVEPLFEILLLESDK